MLDFREVEENWPHVMDFHLLILLFSFREGNVNWINIGEMDLISTRMAQKPVIYGCFRKWWYPHFTPQNGPFLVGKPMGLLGKPTILGNTLIWSYRLYGALGPLQMAWKIKAQTQELAGLTDTSLVWFFGTKKGVAAWPVRGALKKGL